MKYQITKTYTDVMEVEADSPQEVEWMIKHHCFSGGWGTDHSFKYEFKEVEDDKEA